MHLALGHGELVSSSRSAGRGWELLDQAAGAAVRVPAPGGAGVSAEAAC